MCFNSEADCNWAFQQLKGDEHVDNLGRPEKRNAGVLGATVRMSCSEGGRQFALSKATAAKSVTPAKKDSRRAAKPSAKAHKPAATNSQESDDEDDVDDEGNMDEVGEQDAATLVAADNESDEGEDEDEDESEDEDNDDDDESADDTENAAGAKLTTEEDSEAEEEDEELSVDGDSGTDSDDDEGSSSDAADELATQQRTPAEKKTAAKRKASAPSSVVTSVAAAPVGKTSAKLTAAAIATMKVSELKQACEERKLKKTGKKEELQERLAAQLLVELREKKRAQLSTGATEAAPPRAAKRQRTSGATSTEAVLDMEELVAFAKRQRPAWLAWVTKNTQKGKAAAKDPARHTQDDLRSFWQSLQS